MFRLGVVAAAILLLQVGPVLGAEYKLTTGDVYRGEAVSFNDDGVIISREVGGFSPRIPWGRLTQETLKALAEDPAANVYAVDFIEVPVEVKEAERQKRKEIRVTEPPTKLPHVENPGGLFASLANPLGYTLLGLLYLANLYAAMEIARFRGRPVALVVGLSAIAPIIAPLIFAFVPTASGHTAMAPAEEAPVATDTVNPMQQALPTGMQGSGLGLANTGSGKAAANPAYTTVHNRQNATFDRRFFETKFSGFFRVVPADAEKDLLLVVKTPKQELVATRISRISGSEVHFQLQRGTEASVAFGEITEVSVRQKSAK